MDNKLIIPHPGEYVKDAIEAMNMTQNEFAIRTGLTPKNLNTLINGNSNITFETAEKLSRFFNNSIDFWTNLQNRYDIYIQREKTEKEINEDWNIVKLFDKGFLCEVCDIRYDSKEKEQTVLRLRSLFMVSSLTNLKNIEMFAFYKTNIEKKQTTEKETILRNAWISLAIRKANELSCGHYDEEKLKDIIPEIRKMTTMSPEEFTPLLKEKLASAGIKYVELPYLKQSNIRGMTKWIPNENCMMIAVNDCGKVADKIWFTIFHELGHVLRFHKRYLIISVDKDDSQEENEANRFAQDTLINPKHLEDFIKNMDFSLNSIVCFAEKERVSKEIVIGRLQKEGIIDYKTFSKYKKQFTV